MSLQLHSVGLGLEILSADFLSRAHILSGTGTPGGNGGIHDNAPVGSLYLRQDTESDHLQLYVKAFVTNNSAADWRQVVDKEYVDAISQGLSWRAPVRVLDTTLYATAAAFPVTGTIDGVVLADNDRVLFSNVGTATSKNVHIWKSATSTWVEDVNAESDGDAILVQEGSHAEQQWVYDGVNWVQFGGAANAAELGYIRSFIGKTAAGAEFPSYSSNHVVGATDDLETAIGKLDTAIGDRLYTDGNIITDGETVTASLEKLSVAIGSKNYSSNVNVVDGQSTTDAISSLDAALAVVQNQAVVVTATNVTAATAVDSIPLTAADSFEWHIVVEDSTNPTKRLATKLIAVHDGTVVDSSRYATVKRGTNIAGLSITVVINGGNVELRVASTSGVDVGVRRLVALSAN